MFIERVQQFHIKGIGFFSTFLLNNLGGQTYVDTLQDHWFVVRSQKHQ